MISALGPYIGIIKAAAGIAVVVGAFGAGIKVERDHLTAERADELRSELQTNRLAQRAAATINVKVIRDHEKQIATLSDALRTMRSSSDAAGGLRVPRSICDGFAGTASASGRDGGIAGTVKLPDQVENDLWQLVDDAAKVTAQAQACQQWIAGNGFYSAP
jgi:hypothetical protein